MCPYSYNSYDACGHRCIEITEYCPKTVWNAGMTGILQPCGEIGYNLLLQGSTHAMPGWSLWVWKGMSGYCKKCEADFEVSVFVRFGRVLCRSRLHQLSPLTTTPSIMISKDTGTQKIIFLDVLIYAYQELSANFHIFSCQGCFTSQQGMTSPSLSFSHT